jgi:hypothetical protein
MSHRPAQPQRIPDMEAHSEVALAELGMLTHAGPPAGVAEALQGTYI